MATTTTTTTTTSSDEPETVPVKSERFPTRFGHMTLELQREFLDREVNAGRLTPEQSQEPWVRSLDAKTVTDDNKNEENETEEGTSRAPNETKDDVPPIRLFWWQIFSLTGRDPLFKLAKSFYARVFQEENLLFRESFARGGDEKNHATFFAMVLTDAFGGGRLYPGGGERLDDVHAYGSAHIMDQVNAERWVAHMRGALDDDEEMFHKIDPRIRPVIEEFMRFYLNRYAMMFGFDADTLKLH